MSISISSTDSGWQRIMEQLTVRRDRSLSHLASGKRINGAADDAAGLAIATRLGAFASGLQQGERNVADGQSLVQTADSSLQGTEDNLSRMRELSIQAANGTLSASDRQSIQQEYDQLGQQIDQTAGGTSFGGRNLLDGSASGTGSIAIADGSGGGDQSIDLPDSRSAALAVDGLQVSDPNTLSALDSAAQRVSQTRAQLGAADNSFARQQEQLAAARANSEDARSRIEDADIGKEVADRARDRVLLGLQLSGQRFTSNSSRRLLDLLA